MANTDRQYIDFYGVYLYDWIETFGTFTNTHNLMLREYESDAVSSLDSSEASDTHSFLYPFDIEREYYLEGTAHGQITVVATGTDATVTDYKVSIWKTYKGASSPDEELATTGWRIINDSLDWDGANAVGEEMVYPFYIHISPEKQVTEGERLYLKVEFNCNRFVHLWHSNDATYEDVWITIPFKGI